MTAQYRFLFDECLTADLVGVANNNGFAATHVNFLDLRGISDRALAVIAVDTDSVIVTNNARDFKRIYRLLDLHPGLIVILPSVELSEQRHLMSVVLVMLRDRRDCINLLIEIDIHENITVTDWSSDRRNEA